MRNLILFLLAAVGASAGASAQTEDRSISLEGLTLLVSGDETRVGEFLGRDALYLANGSAWIAGSDFTDGVIEYDIAIDDMFGFTGLMFRAANPRHLEYLYLRTAKSGAFDALQYAPVENGNTAWQLYWDPNAMQDASFVFDGWNHVRVVVSGDRADVFINGSRTPTLHIPDLHTDIPSGMIGFNASFDAGTRISNISVRPLQDGDAIVGSPAAETDVPAGTIENWSVSSLFSEDGIAATTELPAAMLGDLQWQVLANETNGITNVSRLHPVSTGNDTVFLSARIASQGDRRVLMHFGYADRARIFLNGNLLFQGDATYGSRHEGFLGLVGLNDAIMLPLSDGENEVVVALSETFGGWGWIASIASREGIELLAPR